MKKEFDTLLVNIDKDRLPEQEKACFERMLVTLQAVDVRLICIEKDKDLVKLRGMDYNGMIGLTGDETMLLQVKALGLPVVYYSNECRGGYGADLLLMSFNEIGYDFFQQIFDRHHGQPWVIAETRRCVIRESLLSDLDAFYEIYAQPSVAKYIEPLSLDYQEEQEKLRAYIKNQYPFYGFGTWTILDAASGQVIGRAGLESRGDEDGLELGYLIREEYQGQGIAFEVCEKILEYARKELAVTDVFVKVASDNEKSVKLAEKLGVKVLIS